jgi:hypothetical protein
MLFNAPSVLEHRSEAVSAWSLFKQWIPSVKLQSSEYLPTLLLARSEVVVNVGR